MSNYLIHYNHNHDKLGRFARSTGGVVVSKGKKNTTRKYESAQRLSKKKGAKSNNTKLSESDRKRLVNEGSLKEITKNKDRLSNRELETAINRLQKEKISRIDLEKKLSDLNNPADQKKKKTAMERVVEIGDVMEKSANTINSGIKLYNNVANVYNRGKKDSDRLPLIGGKSQNNETKPRPWVQEIIDSGDVYEAAKKIPDMTAEERHKVQQAMEEVNKIKAYAKSSNENDKKKKKK